MKTIGVVMLAGLLAGVPGIRGQGPTAPPAAVAGRVALVESADAPGRVAQSHLARLYWQLIREQQLQLRQLPHILVLHLSQKAAASLGRAASRVRTDHCQKPTGESYYQVWLVGEPTLQEYFVGLQNVLQHEFRLHPSEGELKALVARVDPQEAPRVDVQSLLEATVD